MIASAAAVARGRPSSSGRSPPGAESSGRGPPDTARSTCPTPGRGGMADPRPARPLRGGAERDRLPVAPQPAQTGKQGRTAHRHTVSPNGSGRLALSTAGADFHRTVHSDTPRRPQTWGRRVRTPTSRTVGSRAGGGAPRPGPGHAFPRMRLTVVPQTGHFPFAIFIPVLDTSTLPSKSRFSLHFTQ